MGPNEGDMADSLWMARTLKALARIPLETPPEKEPKPPSDFYCIACDSSYCTCKKEKQ